MRLELPHSDSVLFLPGRAAWSQQGGFFGREVSLLDTGRTAAASLSIQVKALFYISPSHFPHFKGPLSPHESLVCYLQFFTLVLCVQGWFEGYNLEKTWDSITDTNIQSPHTALSPPVSHMLVTAAGFCLPGTRQPTCLSQTRLLVQTSSSFITLKNMRGRDCTCFKYGKSILRQHTVKCLETLEN